MFPPVKVPVIVVANADGIGKSSGNAAKLMVQEDVRYSTAIRGAPAVGSQFRHAKSGPDGTGGAAAKSRYHLRVSEAPSRW